ncbi:hypothetical protein MEZE111188_10115 [Mesobacillus zeae]
MNLSGKSTLAGRGSGESFHVTEATKGESLFTKVKLSGARTETHSVLKGVFCPFLCLRDRQHQKSKGGYIDE